MKIAIIGNGPSRHLYEPEGFDKALGCNLPYAGHEVDYVICVDAKAIALAYRRSDRGPGYKRLENGDFQLVIGPRAAHGIRNKVDQAFKADPGGDETVYEDLTAKKYIYKEIGLWHDADVIRQRFFSAGHLAFAFANNEWGEEGIEEVHLFGFDSLFTGTQDSFSDQLRNEAVTKIRRGRARFSKDSPVNTVGEWYNVWERILNSERNKVKKIVIHGIVGDEINDFFKKYMEVQRHEKLLQRD